MPPKRKHSAEAANLPPKRSRLSNLLESHERDDEDQIVASEASVSGPPSSSYPDTSNPHEDYISQNFNGAPTFSQVSGRSDCLNFTPLNVVIAEGTDLFSPLRATCDALQAVIRMETESIKNGEWARLIKCSGFIWLRWRTTVKESLQSYASKLKDIYNFTKDKETDTGPNSGVLGKRLQDFEDTFANYTKTLHLFVARRVEQMRNSLSQAGSVLMNNAMNAHSSRAEDINVYGVQHRQCLPGTRIKTLDAIRHWENDENSTDQMFCLLDFAGSGKSTVSKHMDLEWDRGRKLMARFFFSRDTAETMSTKRFCSVVANKFASRDETFKEVMREFENQPDYGSLSLEQQFDGFIVDPLKALNRRAILIIDALDECDNEHGHRDRLLEVISNHLSAIPHLRVFVTGRPELDIKQWAITTAGVRCTNFFELEGNNDDVGRYIEQRLRNWPSSLQARVYDIVERAEGVFIWARIACDLLCKTKDVQAMLASLSEEVTLDHLYTIALEQSIPKDKHSRRVAVMVLEMVLALQRPLSVAEVAQLSPNPEAIEAVVNSLGSILLYKDRDDPIRLIHATLREYLTSATKSGPWFVQLGRGHYFLASGCIDLATRAEQGPGSDIEEDTFKRKEPFTEMI
ncbi:hypothetical protein FRB91_010659 [Serendipita sp. 411]|nr:hypothetical protein FRB91_010659 [Serendipita sp. 411]